MIRLDRILMLCSTYFTVEVYRFLAHFLCYSLASQRKLEKAGVYNRPIVTEVVSATTFYKAEDYHQRYLEKHGGGICHF